MTTVDAVEVDLFILEEKMEQRLWVTADPTFAGRLADGLAFIDAVLEDLGTQGKEAVEDALMAVTYLKRMLEGGEK